MWRSVFSGGWVYKFSWCGIYSWPSRPACCLTCGNVEIISNPNPKIPQKCSASVIGNICRICGEEFQKSRILRILHMPTCCISTLFSSYTANNFLIIEHKTFWVHFPWPTLMKQPPSLPGESRWKRNQHPSAQSASSLTPLIANCQCSKHHRWKRNQHQSDQLAQSFTSHTPAVLRDDILISSGW